MIQVVSYGGGNNSAAMLVGLWEHGERPDAIVFADTGGEKPHTYAHMWQWMQPWLESVGFPSIQIVRGSQPQQVKDESLEGECLRHARLPSKAYGFSSCSDKWKIEPFKVWVRHHCPGPITRLIGFHAGEAERVGTHTENRYPLIEWQWDGGTCKEVLLRRGLPLPGKSACFFCPSSKAHEIRDLREKYPELMDRALEMERRADAGHDSVKGLGRYFSWQQLLRDHDRQPDFFKLTPEQCSDSCFT